MFPFNNKKRLGDLVPSFGSGAINTFGGDTRPNPKQHFPSIAKKPTGYGQLHLPYSHHLTPNFNLKCGLCVDTFEKTQGRCIMMNCCNAMLHQHCIDCHLKIKSSCPQCMKDIRTQQMPKGDDDNEQQLFNFLQTNVDADLPK
jgi:hypothetical protein